MDRELIQRLASEADFSIVGGQIMTEAGERIGLRLQQFAALVAEECAKIAENVEVPFARDNGEELAAAAIRAAFPKV